MQEHKGTTLILQLWVMQADVKALSTLLTYLNLPVLMEEGRNGVKDRKENRVWWEKAQNCGDSQKKTQTKDKHVDADEMWQRPQTGILIIQQLSCLITVP